MNTIVKTLVGTVAAGAMAVSSATPSFARDGRHDRDGISAGEVIAGALVIGGIAAIAASASRDNNRGYDYAYEPDDYRGPRGFHRDNPRSAVEQCVHVAERAASRRSYGRADVTDIRQVRETRWGWEVRGRIAVNTMRRNWHHGDRYYGNGWGGDYRGWNDGLRGYDAGSFSCRVERGRVTDLDFRGIRGL